QDLSSTAESIPDEVKMQTPAKRPVADPCNDDPIFGKLSSNKVMTTRIKKEKVDGKNL
ncbi:hypothetical protein A2U01_0036618, partial [Trifolium medium]|nr:hypothetical protein [Trifolium medium]